MVHPHRRKNLAPLVMALIRPPYNLPAYGMQPAQQGQTGEWPGGQVALPHGLTTGDTQDVLVVAQPGITARVSMGFAICSGVLALVILGLFIGASMNAVSILPFLAAPAVFLVVAAVLANNAESVVGHFDKVAGVFQVSTTYPLAPWRAAEHIEIPFADLGPLMCTTHDQRGTKHVTLYLRYRNSVDPGFLLESHSGGGLGGDTPLESLIQLQWATYFAGLHHGPPTSGVNTVSPGAVVNQTVRTFVSGSAPPLKQHGDPQQMAAAELDKVMAGLFATGSQHTVVTVTHPRKSDAAADSLDMSLLGM